MNTSGANAEARSQHFSMTTRPASLIFDFGQTLTPLAWPTEYEICIVLGAAARCVWLWQQPPT
jgi:hypothetical protein